MTTFPCPVCQSEVRGIAWRYKSSDIYHCRLCDLQFVYPMVAGDLEVLPFQRSLYETP